MEDLIRLYVTGDGYGSTGAIPFENNQTDAHFKPGADTHKLQTLSNSKHYSVTLPMIRTRPVSCSRNAGVQGVMVFGMGSNARPLGSKDECSLRT